MQNQWSCFSVSTQLEKPLLSGTCSNATIQVLILDLSQLWTDLLLSCLGQKKRAFWGTLLLFIWTCHLLLLEHMTFVDTLGVLSREKQQRRSYDFRGVISWFAAKCDLILLLFNPHSLDINDEFKGVMSSGNVIIMWS